MKLFDGNGVDVTQNSVFRISGLSATIAPSQTSTINVEFQPLIVGSFNNYTMVCLMSNRKQDQLPLCIKLNASSKPKQYNVTTLPGTLSNETIMCTTEKGEINLSMSCYTSQPTQKIEFTFSNLSDSPIPYEVKSNNEDELVIEPSTGIFKIGDSPLWFTLDPTKISTRVSFFFD
jgi:hypothetical protein